MDCSEVKELVSAFYDDELSSDKRNAVADHLVSCDECAHELEGFRGLSAMAQGLSHPEPSARIWQQLERELDVERARLTAGSARKRWGWTSRPAARIGLAVAAVVLIVVAWFGYRTWFVEGDHDEFAAVFGQYLEKFQSNPQAAQQLLLANYESQAVNVEQAADVVGYRPVAADGMPDGYSIESTHVITMPCCKCVQCLCKRDDGKILAIFEHDDSQPMWFGDRPAISARCGDTECHIVQMNGQLAFTLKRGARHITVVGAESLEEVQKLVDSFGQNGRSTPVDSS